MKTATPKPSGAARTLLKSEATRRNAQVREAMRRYRERRRAALRERYATEYVAP